MFGRTGLNTIANESTATEWSSVTTAVQLLQRRAFSRPRRPFRKKIKRSRPHKPNDNVSLLLIFCLGQFSVVHLENTNDNFGRETKPPVRSMDTDQSENARKKQTKKNTRREIKSRWTSVVIAHSDVSVRGSETGVTNSHRPESPGSGGADGGSRNVSDSAKSVRARPTAV
ncbi:Hypothetical protein CINCED_3A015507 [Cinara cedri]|uniref:Uncharacterized protein n=1 Tax=Cinara cedri TaxID=506608 RepID=A0A5E4MJT3_9HEMI|nr:Hypothetical protein CINCED_3A015507 [Cinara cedri]